MLGTPDHPTWQRRPEADLRGLWRFDSERELPTDGWSGSSFTEAFRGDKRLILKRTSFAEDWIVRATSDVGIREATLPSIVEIGWLGRSVSGSFSGFLDAARCDDGAALILLQDLSGSLAAWPRSRGDVLESDALDQLLDAIAMLHASPWSIAVERGWARQSLDRVWCPLGERLTLLTHRSAVGYAADRNRVGPIFLRGWEAFERHASRESRELLERLGEDPAPLISALALLPEVGLHGDLKLANAATDPETGRVTFIDWQMMLRAPLAVELGWFLVTNSAELPVPPDEVLRRYLIALRAKSDRTAEKWPSVSIEGLVGDWDAQVDLVAIVGLLLRGWRKGRDAEDGAVLGSGVTAAEDLASWCARAVEAADRRL